MNGRNFRTVSTPGLAVSPDRTFKSVVNGTPESSESTRSCAVPRASNSRLISSALGIEVFMSHSVPHAVSRSQPHSVRSCLYRLRMATHDPKSFLWNNLCELMGEPAPSIDAVRLKTKIGRGTVQRIKEGSTSVGIDVLATIADQFKIEPWQLLAPSLGIGLFRLNHQLQVVPVTAKPESLPSSVADIKNRSTRPEPNRALIKHQAPTTLPVKRTK